LIKLLAKFFIFFVKPYVTLVTASCPFLARFSPPRSPLLQVVTVFDNQV
jgi:hypothetical protein